MIFGYGIYVKNLSILFETINLLWYLKNKALEIFEIHVYFNITKAIKITIHRRNYNGI
jgi:hypothetical protein